MKYFLTFIYFFTFLSANPFDYTTFEANFTQTITNEQGKALRYTGKIYFKKNPENVVWIYTKPVPKSVYIIAGEVIIYEPKLSQATFLSRKEEMNLASILKSLKKITATSYKTIYNETEIFAEIHSDKPTKIYYKDKMDNRVMIELENVKSNHILESDIFRFKPALGTDFIRQ